MFVNSKDVDEKLAEAATVVKATYNHPYQMHGSVGSSCAVADVQGDKATVWSPTQGVWHQRATLAMLLGLKPENVRVIFRRGSGCYGINGADAVTYDAALLSQAVGKPVRVQLTRKDEMAWENYGFAFTIDERAGLDAQGNIIAWDHEAWSPGARESPGLHVSGKRHHRISGGLSARGIQAALARARADCVQQQQQRGSVLRGGPCGRRRSRRGHDQVGTRPLAQCRVSVLDRPAAFAAAPAKYVRARIFHGRACGPRQSRSRGISFAPSERAANDRRGEGRRESGELGRASLAETARQHPRQASPAGAASPASPTKATTDSRPWSPKSKSIWRRENSP